ncbi:metalloregulator ArsR/SmtB family transcription factor [soil metagenome]
MESSEVVRSLGALAHPVRLEIFRALVVAGADGLTPGVIAEALDLPSATLSFHLKELATSELVGSSRASRHIIYRANYARMDGVIGYLTENCCGGQACLPRRVESACAA